MLKNRILPALAVLLLLFLVLLVAVEPAEARLGHLIGLVYVHGALVWVGLTAFGVSGVLGLLALLMRRPVWVRGTQAAGTTALIAWLACAGSAMAVTAVTWGQVIAWNEPRVRVTALILVAALAAEASIRFVRRGSFTSGVHVVIGIVAWVAVQAAGVVRHPADPIGSSESTAIQVFFVLNVLAVAGLAAVMLTWLWLGAERRQLSSVTDPARN